jgi:hypothetical protein
MGRVLRPFGLTRRPSQHGHERTGQLHAIRSLTITGGAGTGGRLSILVRYILFSYTPLSIHTTAGIHLRKSLEKAWKWSKTQREVANSLDGMVSKDTLGRWEKIVTEYKQDSKKTNPFEEPEICMLLFHHSSRLFADTLIGASVALLRREFLQEESDARKRGAAYLHETTPATFLRQALDIEEKQYVCLIEYLCATLILGKANPAITLP